MIMNTEHGPRTAEASGATGRKINTEGKSIMKFKVYTPGPGFTWEAESLEAATAEAVAYLPLLHRGWYTEMTYAPCSRHTDCGVIIGRGESFNSRGKRQSWVAVVPEQDQQHGTKE